jgi:hypothetical protein
MAGTHAVPDGPDADIQEQHEEVDPGSGGPVESDRVTRDMEVPEADAIEQAQDVPLPPDDEVG